MSSPTPVADPRPPLTLSIGGLTVHFSWQHDRWSHELAFADGTRWQSIEGPATTDADPRWPASPVLVELSRLETPGGPALLGVGRAGRSHFSASIGPDPGRPGGLLFEVACRVHEPPPWLGSTYRCPAGLVRMIASRPVAGPPATVQWSYSASPRGILPLEGTRRADGPPSRAD